MLKIISIILASLVPLMTCSDMEVNQRMSNESPTKFVFEESQNVVNVSTMTVTELEECGMDAIEMVETYATLENSADGSVAYCELEPVTVEVTDISGNEVTYETTYCVDVYEEIVEESENIGAGYNINDNGLVAVPCYTKSNTKADSSGSWRASATLTYIISYEGTTKYIQLTKVAGGWERLANGVSASNRTVIYGSHMQQSSTRYPTGNSFSYTTGFVKDKWSTWSGYGCTTSVKLSRGDNYDPWYLTMTCNIGETDVDL